MKRNSSCNSAPSALRSPSTILLCSPRVIQDANSCQHAFHQQVTCPSSCRFLNDGDGVPPASPRQYSGQYLRLSRGRPGFDSPTGRPLPFLLPNDPNKFFFAPGRARGRPLYPQLEPKAMRWPGIEPGSTAWKAAMLTTIPPTLTLGCRPLKGTHELIDLTYQALLVILMVLDALLMAFNTLHFQQSLCSWCVKGVFMHVLAEFAWHLHRFDQAAARIGETARPLQLLVSIVDSISACHAEDRGSIPRRGDLYLFCCQMTPTNFFLLQEGLADGRCIRSLSQKRCVGRESNPGQLLGRQLCSPLYHQR